MPKKIDVDALPLIIGSLYPAPHDQPCRTRERRRLGEAAGLGQFGVNICRLPPGAWSSQRHWHTHTEEFVYILAGEVTLVTDDGVEILRAGDCAGFPAGRADGHHLRNDSAADALILEVGTRHPEDAAQYSDIDMIAPLVATPSVYIHRDGTPYPPQERSAGP